MKTQVREPIQARSIEKKNRIIDAGYALFEEVGYYNTNTAQIAKRAGVSTGIVYGYFADKRDILLLVTDKYLDKIMTPLLDMIESVSLTQELTDTVTEFLDYAVVSHRQNAKIHEALHSMRAIDKEIDAKFLDFEDRITQRLAARLSLVMPQLPSLTERIHLAMDMLQSFSHEAVFDCHDYINYADMKKIVVRAVVAICSSL